MSPLSSLLARRRNRIALIAGAVLLMVRAVLPYGIEFGIERGGESAVGVPVEVDDVDLSLLRGGIVVERLSVAGVGRERLEDGGIDPETAILRLDRARGNLAWLDLLRGRIRLSALEIAGPVARVEIDEHGAPILPEPAAEEEEPEAEPVAAEEEPEARDATDPESDEADAAAGPEEEAPGTLEAEGSGWPFLLDAFEIRGADFRLHDPASGRDAVALGFASFSLRDVAVVEGAVSLGGMGLLAPSLEARRDYLFAPATPQQAPTAPAQQPAAATTAHRIAHVKLEPVDFTLLTDAGPLELSFHFEASDISTARGETFPIDLGLRVDGGTLTVRGTAGITPASFEGRVAWQDLPLPPIALAAEPALAAWVRSCDASGDLEIAFHAEPRGDTRAALTGKGQLAMRSFHFEDPDEREARVRFDALEVALESLSLPLGEPPAPATIVVSSVRWVEPDVRYATPTPALDALLGDDGAEETTTQAEPTRIRIRRIELSGGDIAFEDRTVDPAYAGSLTSLDGRVTDLRLPAGSGQLQLSGKAPGGSPFSLEGRLGDRTALEFELRKLGLSQFNPYAVGASGYRIDQGTASIETRVTGGGDTFEVRNALVLHELGLTGVGERILDDVIGVPVDVALALLRDLQGDISLGIPLSMDADGTRVGIGKIVRDALRAAIAGAITSPLKIAGAALSFGGGGGLALPPFEMVPGTTVLVPEQQDVIQSVVDLAASRPEMAVTIRGQSDRSDRDGLAVRILAERASAGEDLPDLEDTGFFARRRVAGELSRRARGEAEALDEDDQALLDRYVEATFVPPERFDALARERAEAARNFLVLEQGLPAERVRALAEVESGEPGVILAFDALPAGP